NGKGLASTPALKGSEKSKSKKESFAQREMSNMSVGIEINKTFPLGGQETSPYNINGKQNLLSDYIPAPYFKYFINYKFYVEFALHVNSPQYVRSSKIVSQTDSLAIPTGLYTTKTTSVILNKLYYFDIPVLIHYKLFDHFYLGTGLQFSALSGGVGTEETRLNGYSGVPDSVTSNSIPLKNNSSAYNQLKKLDLRLLLDANYQWRRFTIGLRYQQALATYLKTTQGSSGTSNKNSAIGVYLQYDIWRKK
ncbi:MAG TPA: outer membrane beta-barrel protein, partial [Puia sp.]|nr:outer membrane beta-barrel protein [Puia sp.]